VVNLTQLAAGGFMNETVHSAGLNIGFSLAAPREMSHKSFRLTPDEYMRGKRVIPGLRWIYYFIHAVVGGMFFWAIFTTLRLTSDQDVIFGSAVAEITLLIGMCALAYFLPMFGLPRLFMRLGVLTREQADDFSRHSRRWPESWLEPIPDKAKPIDPK
jgi:hypothetical protein